MASHYLYRIFNPIKHKSYIGVTKNLLERKRCHFSGNGNKLLKEDLKDNLLFEVLVEGSERYIYDLEPLAIKAFDTLHPAGYNLGTGGEGGNITNRSGNSNTQAKLSESIVVSIREEAATGALHRDLAERYDVTRENISCIVRGASWAEYRGPISKRKVVLDEDKELFLSLIAEGRSRKDVANLTGWSYQTIYKYTK